MFKLTSILFVALMLAPSLMADAIITAETKILLANMENATGANTLKGSITSLHISHSIRASSMNLTLNAETYITKDKIASVSFMAGQEFQKQAFDGKDAWSKDMISGLRTLEGKEKFLLISSGLDRLFFPEKVYDEITSQPDVNFQGKKVFQVDLKKKGMNNITFYVDSSTYLVLAEKGKQVSALGEMDYVNTMSNYIRSKKGLLYAKTNSLKAGPTTMKLTVTAFKENSEIDPGVFIRP